jgi:FtsP/CotA-like multicopper oxidase with cupredoxin domain
MGTPLLFLPLDRRALLSGAAAATLTAVFPRQLGAQADATVDLEVTRRTIEVNGRAASAYRLGRADGRPALELPAGRFRARLANRSAEPTLVHWHGLLPPYGQDGVPDFPQPLLPAGHTYSYDFALDTPGTHWMHAHTLQEQELLAAPLIVTDPAEAGQDEQAVVVLFHDFSFTSPAEILAGLRGAAGTPHDAMAAGGMAGMEHSGMAGMAMGAAAAAHDADADADDLNDIEYDAYLANDRTLDDPQVFRVENGGRVRLRLINGATATAFHIDLDHLEGEAVAIDGNPIEPVRGRRFPLGMGQRIDIRIDLPKGEGAWPILALREGGRQRTGFVLATPGGRIARLDAFHPDSTGPVEMSFEAGLVAGKPLTERPADRRDAIVLGGDMAAYVWTLDGRVWSQHRPILVRQHERIELVLRNQSMMAHPMHLHGHHFQVVAIDGKRLNGAVRDTVWITPRREVTIAFDAANPGSWAFHCHHLYHMATGMMTALVYEA